MAEYLAAINLGSKNLSLDNSLLRRTQNGIYLVKPNTEKSPVYFFHIAERLGDADISLQEMEQRLLQIPGWNKNVRSGTYCIEPLQTKLGYKLGRIARPVQGYAGASAFDEADDFTNVYFDRMRHVIHLFEKLLDFGRSVDLTPPNMQVHGNATRDLLIVACFEVEALFKLMIFEDFQTTRGNISVYWRASEAAKLPEYQVTFPDVPTIGPIVPFAQWRSDRASGYTPLTWYQSYNTIKHNAIEGNAPATLANVLNALAACYVLLTALHPPTIIRQISYKRLLDTYRQSFALVSKPEWSAGQHYWKAPTLPLRFSEVV